MGDVAQVLTIDNQSNLIITFVKPLGPLAIKLSSVELDDDRS